MYKLLILYFLFSLFLFNAANNSLVPLMLAWNLVFHLLIFHPVFSAFTFITPFLILGSSLSRTYSWRLYLILFLLFATTGSPIFERVSYLKEWKRQIFHLLVCSPNASNKGWYKWKQDLSAHPHLPLGGRNPATRAITYLPQNRNLGWKQSRHSNPALLLGR